MHLSRMDARDDFVIQIQMLPLGDVAAGCRPRKSSIVREAFLVHPVAQAVDHVFDDADSRNASAAVQTCTAVAAQQKEFGGVAPAGDAADAGNGQAALRDRPRAAAPCAARSVSRPGRNIRRARIGRPHPGAE